MKNRQGNFNFNEGRLCLKESTERIYLGNSPWKNVWRRTPMFPLEVFRTKRSQERL